MAQTETYLELQITGPGGGFAYRLPEGRTTAGRQPGNDLVLDDRLVSRQHVLFEVSSGRCTLTDLGSSNGTVLNGERLPPDAPVPLSVDTEILIGPFRIRLVQQELALESRPEPVEAEPESVQAQPESAEAKRSAAAEEKPAADPASHRQPAGGGYRPAPPDREPPPMQFGIFQPNGSPLGVPGLEQYSQRLIHHLPGIYHSDFMERFLGLFESLQLPIEWTIDNFDLFLHPGTAPGGFLDWLASWFELTFDPTWNETQRRDLLTDAHQIYARRGTKWALARVLEIYTGAAPEIDDLGKELEPFTFQVVLPAAARRFDRDLIEALIDAHKPAHTSYTLQIR